jgi:hypothetical protein
MVRHCSQRDRDPTCLIDLLVYYEVPVEGQRDALKHKYSNYIQKVVDLQQ